MSACFNRLPFEVKTIVWSYIDYDYSGGLFFRESVSLAPYARVSREWQQAFEQLTFREVLVKSNQSNRFKEFKEYIAGNRIASLRSLHFKIILPKFYANPLLSPSLEAERIRADNQAFTKAIKNLWALLETLEDGYPDPRALKLQLHLSAESSGKYRDRYSNLLDFADDASSGDSRASELNGLDRSTETSNRLRFESTGVPEDLPLIPCVHGLIWPLDSDRKIHGATFMKMASRFSGLSVLQVFLGDNLESTQVRSDLAGVMSRLSLPLLSELALNFECRPDKSHIRLRKVSSSSSDAFSIALHRLSQSSNLLKVTLGNPSSGVRITTELFWPQCEGLGRQQKPFWPHLRSLTVLISAVSPEGTWLYTRPTRELESVRPVMTKINPLFVAAAKAAQHMPQLLEMRLRLNRTWLLQPLPCEMAFAAQGHCSKEDTKGYHAALRVDGFLFPGSEKLILSSCQLDLSKPRVSIVMPSRCTIDSRLAQVWKTSKGENVDYKVCSGFVLDDDYNDNDNDDDDD